MLANLISFVRKQQGLTQGELAERIGVSRKTIRNWESGSNIPFNKALSIAEVLDTPLPVLYPYETALKESNNQQPTN